MDTKEEQRPSLDAYSLSAMDTISRETVNLEINWILMILMEMLLLMNYRINAPTLQSLLNYILLALDVCFIFQVISWSTWSCHIIDWLSSSCRLHLIENLTDLTIALVLYQQGWFFLFATWFSFCLKKN